MGLTYIKATVINPADPKKRLKIEFLVDSGAMYSVVPKTILKKLGIKSRETETFTLADGTDITRKVGNALFALDHSERASPIIFGEKGDTPLLGMVRSKPWAISSTRSAASCAPCRWCWGRAVPVCRIRGMLGWPGR